MTKDERKFLDVLNCDDCLYITCECCEIDKDTKQKLKTLIKRLDRENNDLRKLLSDTIRKLRDNNQEDLSDDLLIQINTIPTFYTDETVDYYNEYYHQIKIIEELKSELMKLKGGKD